MATTEPLTGARIPDQSDGPLGGLQIANGIRDLADNTIPRFADASDRDAKYAAWVTAGGTMANGMTCWCDSPGAFYDRVGGTWLRRGQLAYARIGQSADLTQPSGVWATIPTPTLTVEGPSGIYSTATKNNSAYLTHPARNVLIIGKAGLYQFEANATFDTVGVNLRLIRNPEGPIEVFAGSVGDGSSSLASCATTRRCAAGDAIAIQSFHTVAYIAKGDGGTVAGTGGNYTVPTNITVTRIGD